MSGLFITMEGGDGVGKTTQMKLLETHLKQHGYDVISTYDPGGTEIGDAIRNILVNKKFKNMDPSAEAMLYAASRAQLVNQIIAPALKDGYIVLSDRFIDSSVVYQGFGRKLTPEVILKINSLAVGDILPDITFLLQMDFKTALSRKSKSTELDRIETAGLHFHKRVAAGYNELAKKNKDRIKLINAAAEISEIHREITSCVDSLISERSF